MRQFGLAQPLVIQLLEQLPNVEKCSQHDFHFHIPDKLSSWQPVVSYREREETGERGKERERYRNGARERWEREGSKVVMEEGEGEREGLSYYDSYFVF